MTSEMRNLREDEVLVDPAEMDIATDRIIEGVGGSLYTGHTTGWYQNYTPEQRYVGYVVAYHVAMDHVRLGIQNEISDEVVFLLGAAPADDEARQAGLSDAVEQWNQGNKGARSIYRSVYFTEGKDENPYSDQLVDVEFPKIGAENYRNQMMNRLQGMADGEDWYEPNFSFMPWQADPLHVGWLAQRVAGIIPGEQPIERPPTQGDLFAKVIEENKSPGGMAGGIERTASAWGPRAVAVASVIGLPAAAARGAVAGGSLIARVVNGMRGGGTIASALAGSGLRTASGLNRFANVLQKGNRYRRVAALGSAAYAGSSYGFELWQARNEPLSAAEDELYEPIEDYRQRRDAGETEASEEMDVLTELMDKQRRTRAGRAQVESMAPSRDRRQTWENRFYGGGPL